MHRLVIAVSIFAAAAAALSLAACGDDDGESVRPDAGPHVDAGPEPTSLGEFYVTEMTSGYDDGAGGITPVAYGNVVGRVRTGASPVWHQEVANDGTCKLLKFTPGSCDAYCEGVCVGVNDCQPYPANVSVGRVTLTGLKSGTLTLDPQPSINWYYPQNQLPVDLFDDDATVHLSAAGAGEIPAFATQARAVPTLKAAITAFEITLTPGQDHIVKWTPSGDPEQRVRLTINANNQGHGFPYDAIIECDVYDDAAQIRIPAAMIDAFPETHNWSACAGNDCPRSWIRRYRRAYASIPGGGIRLEVGSEIDFGVEHVPAP